MNAIVTTGRTELASVNREARNDETVIELWLHGRSEATMRAYRADAKRLQTFVAKPLAHVTLEDLHRFSDSLVASGASPATQARTLAAIKSLFSYARELGHLPFDVALPVKLPKVKNTLAERIISERGVLRMIGEKHDGETAMEKRNRMICTLLYAAGLRVSELCGLCWRDAQERSDVEGQVTVYGKGGKTRVVKLPASVWSELVELRGDASHDDPVFVSREGGALDQSQVNRIIHAAAKRARLSNDVSPHWLRHAHASHAIERGAPIHLVQSTLGHASVATTGRYLHARPSESSSRYLAI